MTDERAATGDVITSHMAAFSAARHTEQLGLREAAALLKQTLDEEKKTDAALSKLAEAAINKQAA